MVTDTKEYRERLSKSLKGVKKPPRTKEHTLNHKISNSMGIWKYKDSESISSYDLAKMVNIPRCRIYKWCKFNEKKIGKITIVKYPNIFDKEDFGKTFKQKGFDLIRSK